MDTTAVPAGLSCRCSARVGPSPYHQLSQRVRRGASPAFFWLTLFSLPFALAVAHLHGETDR